jgi:hypothetical protein
MSLYSQNVSNNPLSLDGLITGNFDLLYVDGEPITPTDTSGLVPYIGANATVNLNTQNIKSSFVPLLPEDLTNKQYTDDKYLNKAGFSVSSGGFVFDGTSTLYLHGTTNIVVPAVSPSYSLGIDATGDLIKFTGGTGDAVLSAGTSLSPQIFTGYDKFNNLLKTADIDTTGNITASGLTTTNTLKILTTTTTTPLYSLGILGTGDVVQFTGGTGDAILNAGTLAFPQQFTGYNFFSNLWCGAVRFPFGVASGTPNYILGVDTTTGNLVSTAPTSAPTQLTVLNQSTVAGNYYPVYITNTASGVRPVYSMNGAFYEPITQIWEATNIKSVGTTTCVGTLFTQSGITNMAGQFLITDNLRSPNTGMTFIIPSAIATFGFQNNTTELLKIDSTGITVSRHNSVYDTTMIFNTSGPAVPPLPTREMSFRYNNTPFMTASPNSISMNAPLTVNMISSFISSNLALSATGTNYVSIQGVQFTTADILTLTSQIFYSSKIYAQSGVNLLYNVNSGYNHNFNVNGVNTLYINSAGLVMNGGNAINCANIENSTYVNFNIGGVTRFAITQNGGWMPPDGSTSLYIRDTYTTATTTYGRYFGVSGTIYQDFYNQFKWRRDAGLTGGGVVDIMSLDSNGLTLQNAIGIGQPQLVFAGSGVPTIRMNGGGMNWFMNSTTNMGYMDSAGFTSGGGVAGTGWRINGTEGLTLKSGRGIYLNPGFGAVNSTVNSIIPHSGTGTSKWGSNGWFSYGGAQVCSYDPVGNVSTGIGMGVSFDNNWCYISMVKPGNYWAQGIIETGNANWYVNGALASYITGGGWTNVSDQRCKCDINDLSTKKSLQRVLKCKPKYYKRIIQEAEGEMPIQNKQEDIDRVHIGLLAQEVQEFNPHCVSTWKDGDDANEKLGIQYNDFVIHLIGAVQEQQKTIEELKDTSKKQEETINTLLAHLTKLTEQVNQITLKMV